MNLSVLILTYNEEVNIEECLESVACSDDIWVLDSHSSDRTCEIAQAKGAQVEKRVFDNYAAQRNFALSLPLKYDWVLMLDADELATPEVIAEIQEIIHTDTNPVTLYRMRRKDMFMDRWLKRSSGYPTWFARLFRKGRVQVEREINEEYTTDGKVGLLTSHLIHYPFNKGTAYWIERHNKYSTMEAKRLLSEMESSIPWGLLFDKDPALRRKAFKQIAYRLPCRPFLAFTYLYFLKLGFLDGIPGFHYSRMRAMYEYMIELKMKELRRS
jgi:glycosyltransferase involved in cell wall biosynthesis